MLQYYNSCAKLPNEFLLIFHHQALLHIPHPSSYVNDYLNKHQEILVHLENNFVFKNQSKDNATLKVLSCFTDAHSISNYSVTSLNYSFACSHYIARNLPLFSFASFSNALKTESSRDLTVL